MKDGLYYQAWCGFERIEINLDSLREHFVSVFENDLYNVNFIEKHVKQFQSLFPYRLFLSPAWLYLGKVCSVCGNVISIRNPCGHIKGEIYDGEMCVHEITKVELLEISAVTNPVQKYSVLFLTDPESDEQIDHYDYTLVKYAVDALHDPFHAWDLRQTKLRHPHSHFVHIGKNDDCPCGSEKIYRECCLQKDGVLRPHMEFTFSMPPPNDLPRLVFPDIKKE